jgi:hypothetical protein
MNAQQRIADQNADKFRDQFWTLLRKDRANRLATLIEKKTRAGTHREVRDFLLRMDPMVLLTMVERNCSLSWAERRVNKGGPKKAMEQYFFAALDYGRLCTGK